MKLKHILALLVATTILASCEQLGIEVTTVKGKWKSEITDGQYISLDLSPNDTYSSTTIFNDSTELVKHQGTWVLNNDTLCLYRQDIKGNGVRKLFVEQLSMNTITLRNVKNGNTFVLNRIYSTSQNDYDSHFEEVFDLKGGFWWYAWRITSIVLGLLLLGTFGMALYNIVGSIIKWCKNKKSK